MWYRFFDMGSGGYDKTEFSNIYIEAFCEDYAVKIFENKFGISPYNITCSCCGEDFSISEVNDFKPEEFKYNESIKIIYKDK